MHMILLKAQMLLVSVLELRGQEMLYFLMFSDGLIGKLQLYQETVEKHALHISDRAYTCDA